MRAPTWLSGVGAAALADAVVFATAYALWVGGVLRFTSRPDFEFIELPAYALGAAVARATSQWRGVLALAIVASLWIVTVPFVPGGADRAFLLAHGWAYAGIGAGVLIGAARPARGDAPLLAAVGVYGTLTFLLASTIQPLCYWTSATCAQGADALTLLVALVAGTAAGVAAGRVAPLSALSAVALVLALPAVLIVAHQGAAWQYDGALALAATAHSAAAAIAFALAAAIARARAGPLASARMHPRARA
jgi:hypothetical protein